MFSGACIYPPSPHRWKKKKSRNLLLVTRGRRNKEKESDWRDLIDDGIQLITCQSIVDGFSATSLSFWFVPEVVALLLVGLIHATAAARSLWAKFAHRTYAGKVHSTPMTQCYIRGWATREILIEEFEALNVCRALCWRWSLFSLQLSFPTFTFFWEYYTQILAPETEAMSDNVQILEVVNTPDEWCQTSKPLRIHTGWLIDWLAFCLTIKTETPVIPAYFMTSSDVLFWIRYSVHCYRGGNKHFTSWNQRI